MQGNRRETEKRERNKTTKQQTKRELDRSLNKNEETEKIKNRRTIEQKN